MPFTISHTAAVLPFARFLRRWHLLSAAVIGSLVPDFGVFLPHLLQRYETHGIVPLFMFCLPMGLLWYWVFQLHIKVATLELMPDRLYRSWAEDARPASPRSVRQWLTAALGVLLGAATHLVWDAFTHENARGVRMLTALDGMGLTVAGYPFTWYRLLQHVSSVVGLLFVIWFIWRDVRRATYHGGPLARLLDAPARHRWFAVYVSVALGASAIVFVALQKPWRSGIAYLIADMAVSSLWGLLISLLTVSALVRGLLRRAATAATG